MSLYGIVLFIAKFIYNPLSAFTKPIPHMMTPLEDNFNGRRPQWKMTIMDDNLNGRQPQWMTTSMEDNLVGRLLQ